MFRSSHSPRSGVVHEQPPFRALPWKEADGATQLAREFGQIATDLWLGGKLTLTAVPFVATVGACHATHDDAEDSDREAANRSPGPETLERRSAS